MTKHCIHILQKIYNWLATAFTERTDNMYFRTFYSHNTSINGPVFYKIIITYHTVTYFYHNKFIIKLNLDLIYSRSVVNETPKITYVSFHSFVSPKVHKYYINHIGANSIFTLNTVIWLVEHGGGTARVQENLTDSLSSTGEEDYIFGLCQILYRKNTIPQFLRICGHCPHSYIVCFSESLIVHPWIDCRMPSPRTSKRKNHKGNAEKNPKTSG